MSARSQRAAARPAPARCAPADAPPDITIDLPADRRAPFRARGEIHRVLHDVHPQRRAVAARLVGALLDSATSAGTAPEPVQLQLSRSPTALRVQLHSIRPMRLSDESRLVLDRLADRWELDHGSRTIRMQIRTTPSRI